MFTFTIAREPKMGLYQVHASDCSHSLRVEHCYDQESVSVDALVEDFETGNDGCFTKVMACVAKRGLGKQSKDSKAASLARQAAYFG